MLEKYLSQLLSSKFGHIVEDFDKEAVNISAWKGEISLKDVILKQLEVESIELVYGKIGSLDLQIPWNSIRSKPSSIVLTDVSLLITPRLMKKTKEQNTEDQNDVEDTAKTENTNKTPSKEEKVQELLNPKILQHSIATATHNKNNRLARLLSWVSSSVFSNLSVTVKNIHIRYEDPGSSLGFVWSSTQESSVAPFAVGLTLNQFSVQTTNIADQDSLADDKAKDSSSVTRKVAAMYQLAMYWDHGCPLVATKMMRNPSAAREIAASAFQIMQGDHAGGSNEVDELISDLQAFRYQHSYLLQPISPSLQITLVHNNDESSTATARRPSTLTLSLPPCHLIVSRSDLESVAYLRKSVAFWKQSQIAAELNETLQHLKQIRPQVAPLKDKKAWWRYAIQATILLSTDQSRKRTGWVAIAYALLKRLEYKAAYKRLVGASAEEAHEQLLRLEDELEDTEIANFRLAAYEAILEDADHDAATSEASPPGGLEAQMTQEIADGKLSLEVRKFMLEDAIRILRQGRLLEQKLGVDSSPPPSHSDGTKKPPLIWKTSLFCPEFALQVNGRNSSQSVKPIVRLSFACIQRQYLRQDGSWEMDATVAGVKLVDLTTSRSGYPTLIGSKNSNYESPSEDDFVMISGTQFRRCMQIEVQRQFSTLEEGIVSKTHSRIRLEPLEVTYSTSPVARTMHVFSSIRTPELAGDYERMASVVSQWQERQRNRLLQALAHKRKKITLDIDVCAPVILVPQGKRNGGGSMLIVDLGRLQVHNDELEDRPFDDAWSLILSDMQVQTCSLVSTEADQLLENQQVVEPFSMKFQICTTIASNQKKVDSGLTSIIVDASLPRLAFNLRSSTIQLLTHLGREWNELKQSSDIKKPRTQHLPVARKLDFGSNRRSRRFVERRSTSAQTFKFAFSAPTIILGLEDDTNSDGSVPLINLALKGIGGQYEHSLSPDGSLSIEFVAKMSTLQAVDLYQSAGEAFAMLLSSVNPAALKSGSPYESCNLGDLQVDTDLVSLQYVQQTEGQSKAKTTSIGIAFHELFVEWNPETIAAIQKATKVPLTQPIPSSLSNPDPSNSNHSRNAPFVRHTRSESDDEFFDAFEEDLESFRSVGEDDDSLYLSEIGSDNSLVVDEREAVHSPSHQPSALTSQLWIPSSPTMQWMTPLNPVLGNQLSPTMFSLTAGLQEPRDQEVVEELAAFHPFEISFELHTLRVSFNKETRHRRLVIAEMDNTSVRHSAREEGGTKTEAKIGNLVFTDPDGAECNTLYSQILGLKSEASFGSVTKESSLFEMELIINKRTKSFEAYPESLHLEKSTVDDVYGGVIIDKQTGDVKGCDVFIDLKFSPMRFVYLQQLWFEIIDYFFEGIVGYEVWGNERPTPQALDGMGLYMNPNRDGDIPTRLNPDIAGSDAEGVSFTRFRISLESPDILLPVEDKSPDFVRLNCDSCEVSNVYNSRVHKLAHDDGGVQDRVQWYNNCTVRLNNLHLVSWCGSDLTSSPHAASGGSKSNVSRDANIQFSWPTGPTAKLVLPKWRVRCSLDELILNLRSQDYALFMHMVQRNIGEPSRHLDEWNRFQNMPTDELQRYKEKIKVHYGYDKKDTAPSTYDVEVRAPLIAFNLLDSSDDKGVVAQLKCLNLTWSMSKSTDHISRQVLAGNLILSKPHNDEWRRPTPLLLPTKRGTALDGRPDVVYTSITQPSGDNVKTLEIFGAGINFIYPVWRETMAFFSDLGEVNYMTPDDIRNSLQVGDRWYPIGSLRTEKQVPTRREIKLMPGQEQPTYSFKLLLDSPRIVLDSEKEGNSVILHMEHFDFNHIGKAGEAPTVNRQFFVNNLELYTQSNDTAVRDSFSVDNSLIHPWSVIGAYSQSYGCIGNDVSSMEKKTLRLSAEVLKARSAYTDMTIALDVTQTLLDDLKERNVNKIVESNSQSSEVSKEEDTTKSVDSSSKTATALVSSVASIQIEGLDILVVDDSLRHFAKPQELISFSLGRIWLKRDHKPAPSHLKAECWERIPDRECRATLSSIKVESLELVDCLQRRGSPFALAATTHSTNSFVGHKRFRVLDWHSYHFVKSELGYKSTAKFDHLMETHNSDIVDADSAIEYHYLVLEHELIRHNLSMRSLSTQYNPSTIIALQRFAGRLMKEAKGIFAVDDPFVPDSKLTHAAEGYEQNQIITEASFAIGGLAVSLNKEHQNRRLAKAVLKESKVKIRVDSNMNASYIGRVGDIEVVDEDKYESGGIMSENRPVLMVQGGNSVDKRLAEKTPFFEFCYTKFTKHGVEGEEQELPQWIFDKLRNPVNQGDGTIDDYLSISMASLQFTYIRGRTEELMDYLSNGLPGRGMGATSKAAKGFINKRIQTRSFLDLSIASPLLRLPQKEAASSGLHLRLGDVRLKTWFELEHEADDSGIKDWCRALSVSITGLGWNTFMAGKTQYREYLPADLHFDLRKPRNRNKALILQARLSSVELILKYSDYCLIRAVLSNNIGRKVDVVSWDNVEKAYWLEEERHDASQMKRQNSEEKVEYSTSARFVRYGIAKGESKDTADSDVPSDDNPSLVDPEAKEFDFQFVLDGIKLTLHRDDSLAKPTVNIDAEAETSARSEFAYDMILLRLEAVEMSLSVTRSKDMSFHASLSRIGLFDLGDSGRLVREQYLILSKPIRTTNNPKPTRSPSAFSVIAEGYNPVERAQTQLPEPQVVLTVDTCPAAAVGLVGSTPATEIQGDRVTVARMVINYISVNAMIRPLREVMSFVSCSWPSSDYDVASFEPQQLKPSKKEKKPKNEKSLHSAVQFKLVAHYPRVFFVADESDHRSRALVLRGLAVVNVSLIKKSLQNNYSVSEHDSEYLTSLDASLHSMESFINPDVGNALSARPESSSSDTSSDLQTLGVALIQPVTAGIEYQQVAKDRFPTIRSMNVTMEAVSTMLSFEDLSLINQVIRRWSPERHSHTSGQEKPAEESIVPPPRIRFDVIFHTARLGLSLKNVSGDIVVDDVDSAKRGTGIRKGDTLELINNGAVVPGFLQRVVQLLSRTPRPMTLTFSRQEDSSKALQVVDPKVDQNQGPLHSSPSSESEHEDEKRPVWYKMRFKMGTSNGIVIKRSHGGDIPVVVGVDPWAFTDALDGIADGSNLALDSGSLFAPRSGTVIVAVSGLKSLDLGFDETSRVLDEFAKPSYAAESEELKDASIYTISFLELSAADWGSVDSFDARIYGIELTFIDDFEGRDMPLLRGKLRSFEIHLQQGVGLISDEIDTATASVFSTVATAIENPESNSMREEACLAFSFLSREKLVKATGSYVANIDYYHPRVAIWEPLLEPSLLTVAVVWKAGVSSGRQRRPGQLFVELSDIATAGRQVASTSVAMNLTEAAAEVIARTIMHLRDWGTQLVATQPDVSGYDLVTPGADESDGDDRESNLSQEAVPVAPPSRSDLDGSCDEQATSHSKTQGRPIKHAAAREAAQAALNFAQKRGANVQENGESATPFILRNKTGLDLIFSDSFSLSHSAKKTHLPGGDEARFQMEVISSNDSSHDNRRKKVRSYEGQFPSLVVWFESSTYDISFEPLENLQVSKVGTFVRDLRCPKGTPSNRLFQLPILWTVELDDNRRILTLSSAVQLSSEALGLELEIGYSSDDSTITKVGEARRDIPFFLPLWLSLQFRSTEVYLRPSCKANASPLYQWTKQSILQYRVRSSDDPKWVWQESFCAPTSIVCEPAPKEGVSTECLWLACFRSSVQVDLIRSGSARGARPSKGIINIVVDSSLSLRNMLPVPFEWELANSTFRVFDGSAARNDPKGLHSGTCVEVLGCAMMHEDVFLRLRWLPNPAWTDWARISSPVMYDKTGEEDAKSDRREPAYRLQADQTNVSMRDDFGTPIHFGIRMNPKVTNQPAQCISYGVELVVYAELWFSNLTNLPLSFGCPWAQLSPSFRFQDDNADDESTFESAGKAAAEAALAEIASVLELGDKGKGLRSRDQQAAGAHNIFSIPMQATEETCAEVFEYIQVEFSTVKKRWWATEEYERNSREKNSYGERGPYWQWVNDSWSIDYSGDITEAEGGWESCRSLGAGRESYFAGRRTLEAGHIYRRRRWFRHLTCNGDSLNLPNSTCCFHQPVKDSFSRVQRASSRKESEEKSNTKGHWISVRCRDGVWSSPAQVPLVGPTEGAMRVLATRWPTITKTERGRPRKPASNEATITPGIFDLCYSVAELPGDWGEFSRLLTVTPRFLFRNDSSSVSFELKQAGVPDSEAMTVYPGNTKPFYWADFRLPELVSIRPLGSQKKQYRWSGGFDICTIGAVPLRIRSRHIPQDDDVFSVKALIEIRSSTSGVNVTLKEEDRIGSGALFRVENQCPFPIWIAQDGVLANPTISFDKITIQQNEARRHHDQVNNLSDHPPELDGEIIFPRNRKTFALDVPFRQGKYANRKAASLQELLRVRVGLAPLSTRDGIETTKLINFTTVGESTRLNPSKLRALASLGSRVESIRVLGIVATDGPTRVLRFALMDRDVSPVGSTYRRSPTNISTVEAFHPVSQGEELYCQVITKAGMDSIELYQSGKVRDEESVKRDAFFNQQDIEFDSENLEKDIVFNFRANFGGFLFSLIDSAPSEIATVSIKRLEIEAKWNMNRTADATVVVSLGWLQVDNHIPNAPYSVAVCPDHRERDGDRRTPLLMASLKFAPKHQSGILCLRSVTVAPYNLAIAIDLAFIVRLQGLFLGIIGHFHRGNADVTDVDSVETIAFPDLATSLDHSATFCAGSQNLYFEGLTILPSNVNLSVAPARALTAAQASLEGPTAAAIHAAVRKGDVRLAAGGMVGVTVGRTNRTALAVVRGVLKSIIVDALIRLDGASLDLAGVFLSNYVSSSQQLRTYLVSHYIASLRSNVPALLGSMAAFGNPLGLIRGIGDGVSDFVNEPVKGLKKSVEELDPLYVVDGVARGTESLARHTVGGIADSASMLTETFSKNMTALTLDRRYAQRRDIARSKRDEAFNFVEGVESGVAQLVKGFVEGVTGVVRAPIRGAEKSGIEGFAKGIGKGLLGLLVKPMIGISDAATDLMIGVKSSVDGGQKSGIGVHNTLQLRPRRAMYGKYRTLRTYSLADAAAATLMHRTKLAGENYLGHLDMGDRVLLVSVKRFILLGPDGQELIQSKFKYVESVEVKALEQADGGSGWGVIITMANWRKSTPIVEVVNCGESHSMANEMKEKLERGMALVETEFAF